MIFVEFQGNGSLLSEFMALFPLVIPFGGFILVPNLGKEYTEGKEEEQKPTFP